MLLYIHQGSCKSQCDGKLLRMSNDDTFELYRYGETIAQNDIVRSQYSSLPYPAVPRPYLIAERVHYKEKKNKV